MPVATVVLDVLNIMDHYDALNRLKRAVYYYYY